MQGASRQTLNPCTVDLMLGRAAGTLQLQLGDHQGFASDVVWLTRC
jgi:hypothetical protein